MAELKPGWMDRQFARIESEISIMPTFLLPPEMQEQRKKMIKAEIIKAMIDFYIINYAEMNGGEEMTEFDDEVIFTLIPLLNKYLWEELKTSCPQ